MKFTELKLHPQIQKALDKKGFESCTDIQKQAIPKILDGMDIAGLAQTGTGKTAAFLLPLIDRLLRSLDSENEPEETKKRVFKDWKKSQYFLVLVPTRELAEQVMENCKDFCEFTDFKAVSVYGGTSYESQKELLNQGVQFVIATPGRLIDLYKNNAVDLKQVRGVVFDEADRMFDMGFKDDMKYVLSRIPRERQFLVFSATLNFDVLNTAYEFGADPVEINVNQDQATAKNVEDGIYHVGDDEKGQFLLSLLKKDNPKQTIIFSNFKFQVERIVHFLKANGIPAVGISSLLNQSQRNKAMEAFKNDETTNILVATDVAARGLDVKGVDLVVNYELPGDSENYVHRIGRTGRADSKGTAYSLVSEKDVDSLSRIEDYLKAKLEVLWLENDEMVKDFKAFSRHSDVLSSKKRQYKDTGPKKKSSRHGGKKRPSRSNNKNRSKYNSERDKDKDKESTSGERSGSSKKHKSRKRTHHKNKSKVGEKNSSESSASNKKHKSKKKRPNRRPNKKLSKNQKKVYSSRGNKSSSSKAATGGVKKKVSSFLRKLFG